MEPARRRVLDDFPFPMAYPYKLIFDPEIAPSICRFCMRLLDAQSHEPVNSVAVALPATLPR